jgi:diguanylate cyclase (GGDEF)-like protein
VIGGEIPFAKFGWTLVVEEPYDDAFEPVVAMVRKTAGINLGIVLLFTTIAFFAARSIVRPIHSLSEAAARFASGDLEVDIPTSTRADELGILTRAFGEMISMLRQNQSELEKKNRKLERLSVTDGLTRLYNHRYFQKEIAREMRRSRRSGDPLSLILIDVDDFKKLNDRWGHATGDNALVALAKALRKNSRNTDVLARYGGEEFALLTLNSSFESALKLAEKIRQAVASVEIPIKGDPDAAPLHITVSIGVAQFEGDENRFFTEADRALYVAKEQGKDRVAFAGDS